MAVIWNYSNTANTTIFDNYIPRDDDSLEDILKAAITDKVVVYNSDTEDGTVYLQVRGPDGKTYNIMVVIEQD